MNIIFPILTVFLFTLTFNGFRTFISLSLCELHYKTQEISAVLSSISIGLFMATIFFRNIISSLGIYRTYGVSICIMLLTISGQAFITNIKFIVMTNFIFSFFANISFLCLTDIFFVYTRSFFDTYFGIFQSIGRLSSFLLFFLFPVSLTPLYMFLNVFIFFLVGSLLFFNFTSIKASIVKEEIGRADTIQIMINYFSYFSTITICNISDTIISGFLIFSLKILQLSDKNIIVIIFLFNAGKLTANILFDFICKIFSEFISILLCAITLVAINVLIIISIFDSLIAPVTSITLHQWIYLCLLIFALGCVMNFIRVASLRFLKKKKTLEHREISAQQTHTQIENLTSIIGVTIGIIIVKVSPACGIFLTSGAFGILLILILIFL